MGSAGQALHAMHTQHDDGFAQHGDGFADREAALRAEIEELKAAKRELEGQLASRELNTPWRLFGEMSESVTASHATGARAIGDLLGAGRGGARCDETARRCEETARTSAAFIDEVDGEPMAVRLSGLLPGLPTSPRSPPTSRPRSPSSPWMPIIKRASSPGGGAVAWGRGGGVTVQQAKLRAFPRVGEPNWLGEIKQDLSRASDSIRQKESD